MKKQKKEDEKEQKKSSLLKKIPGMVGKKIWIVVCIIVIFGIGTAGVHEWVNYDGQTVRLGFEDIGEFATQSVYCQEVESINEGRKIFNVKIPFTDSKIIFSYGVTIKAGYDFKKVKWSVNDDNKKITVSLPEAKILSASLDTKSLKIYYEEESLFKNISVKDYNRSLDKLEERAKKTAIKNGLYEKTRENAEVLLKGFFANKYDLKEYVIEFKDK